VRSISEYQRYELVALDAPLSSKQMAERRAVSTRADITSTRHELGSVLSAGNS